LNRKHATNRRACGPSATVDMFALSDILRFAQFIGDAVHAPTPYHYPDRPGRERHCRRRRRQLGTSSHLEV